MTTTAEDITRDLAIICQYPNPDDHDVLPDWADAWRTSEFCSGTGDHAWCGEADWMARLYARTPKVSREERRDAFVALHGRDPEWGEDE